MKNVTEAQLSAANGYFAEYGDNAAMIRAALVLNGVATSENEARMIVKEAGLQTATANRGNEESRKLCVEIMRTSNLGRKEMADKIVEDCGYTLATAKHYIAAIPLCKEWARQESE